MQFVVQIRLLLLLLLSFSLTACQRDENTAILSEEEMAEVLYDYQLASALAGQVKSGDGETLLRYRQSVFHKHQITEADFQRSMKYYSRNTKEMEKVYRLVQRINPNASEQVLSEGAQPTQGGGDTLILWSKDNATLVANRQNRFIVSIQPSDSLKAGDQLFLRFRTQWHYRQGSKQGVGILMVRYANDTVVARTQGLYAYEEMQRLQLRLEQDLPVKEVAIQIYQQGKWEEYPQIMNLRDIQLLKVSEKKSEPAKADTTSLNKVDSLELELPTTKDSLPVPDAPKTFRR